MIRQRWAGHRVSGRKGLQNLFIYEHIGLAIGSDSFLIFIKHVDMMCTSLSLARELRFDYILK